MAFLSGAVLARVIDVIGKEPPPKGSVLDLANLPVDVAKDLQLIYQSCGSICAFAYLHYVSDASFDEVKLYLDSKGWHESAE